MNFLRLLPVLLSYLLLAAHFYRAGQLVLVALSLGLPLLLFVRHRYVPALLAAGLVLGAAEWALTLMGIAEVRMALGLPWQRMAVILGGVALFTLLSALVFLSRALRARYATSGAGERSSSSN
jgi:hypothetical protein